jgi:hypothetical protein
MQANDPLGRSYWLLLVVKSCVSGPGSDNPGLQMVSWIWLHSVPDHLSRQRPQKASRSLRIRLGFKDRWELALSRRDEWRARAVRMRNVRFLRRSHGV